MNELELIAMVKTQKDSAALQKLADMHSGILYNKAAECQIPYKATASVQDLFANRFEAVYVACNKYDGRAQFNTFLGHIMKWHCLNQIKTLVDQEETNFELEPLINSSDQNGGYCDKHGKFGEYLKLIDKPKVREVVKLRCVDRMKWHEMGALLNVSHTRCQQRFQTGLDIIKNKLNHEQIAA